jgi:hypothetical protein
MSIDSQLVINLNICGVSNDDDYNMTVMKVLESVDLRAAVQASLASSAPYNLKTSASFQSGDFSPQPPSRRMSTEPHAPLLRPRPRSSTDMSELVVKFQQQQQREHDDDNSTITASVTSTLRRCSSSNDTRSLTMAKTLSRSGKSVVSNSVPPRATQGAPVTDGGNDSDSKVYTSTQGKRRRERAGTRRRCHSAGGSRSLVNLPVELTCTKMSPLKTQKRRGSNGYVLDEQSLVSELTKPSLSRWDSNSGMMTASPVEARDGQRSDGRVYTTAQGKQHRERTMNRNADERTRSQSANSMRSFPLAPNVDAWFPQVVHRARHVMDETDTIVKQVEPRGVDAKIPSASSMPPNMPRRMGSINDDDTERIMERRERRSKSHQRAIDRSQLADGMNTSSMGSHSMVPPNPIRRSRSTGNPVVSGNAPLPRRLGSFTDEDSQRVQGSRKQPIGRVRSTGNSVVSGNASLPRRLGSFTDEDSQRVQDSRKQPIGRVRSTGNSVVSGNAPLPRRLGSFTDEDSQRVQDSRKLPIGRVRSTGNSAVSGNAPVDHRRRKSTGDSDLKMLMARKKEIMGSSYTDLFGGTRDRPSCMPARRMSTNINIAPHRTSSRTESTQAYYGDLFSDDEDDEDHFSHSDSDDEDDDDEVDHFSHSDSDEEDDDDEVLPLSVYPTYYKGASTASTVSYAVSVAPWICICGEEKEHDNSFCGMCARSKTWTCDSCNCANNKCRAIFCGGCATQRSALAA